MYVYSKDFGPKIRVVFYCIVTAIPLFVFNCFSLLLSKTNTGIGSTLAIDISKLFFILGFIINKA